MKNKNNSNQQLRLDWQKRTDKIIFDVHANKRMEERLANLNECFLSFNSYPVDNINRLVAVCGELMNGYFALYNSLNSGLLCSIGQWNTPPDYSTVYKPEGHICYETIKQARDQLIVIRNLNDSPYVKTDSNVKSYNLKTYIGRAVKFGDNYFGSLCVVYKKDFIPSKDDEWLMGVIASAIAVEVMRKRDEEALRESEEKYRTLTENINVGIYRNTSGPKSKFIEANPALIRMFGYKNREEFLKINVADLYNDSKDMKKLNKKLLKDGSVKDEELLLKKKDGTPIWCSVTAVAVCGDKGNIKYYFDGVIEDITDRKIAEEEKEKIQTQLFQAQKMEAIGILAGGIAHDFNNLLTVIQGCTEIMMINIDKSHPSYGDLGEIRDASWRAAELTRQLLLFSRKHQMEFIPLELNNGIETLFKMLQRLIGEDVEISIELEEDLWTVRADKGSIEQVIMNLVVNARDAMPEGGEITIKTENIVLDESYCKHVPQARPGRFICLSVADTGIGMNKNTVQYIFEPFFTTKAIGKGSGLGLSVVYGIVKQHNGWINVYSEPNKGTTFQIFLPTVSWKPEERKQDFVSLESLRGNGERILVVEDDDSVREFAKRALNQSGYEVFSASYVEEALKIFDRENGNFNLVFSDVVLPDKSGIELINELQYRKPEMKFLLKSFHITQKSQKSAIEEKGIVFLQKPYALIDLLQTVKEVMA